MIASGLIRIPVDFPDQPSPAAWSVVIKLDEMRAVQRTWAEVPLSERLGCVRRLRKLLAVRATDLAAASAAPRRRPAAEMVAAEVLPLAEACRFLERRASAVLRPRRCGVRGRPFWLPGVRSEIQRAPLGVALIIGPSNYPLLLPGVQWIQALAAGNAVLVKPGNRGVPVAQLFSTLLTEAGFPAALSRVLSEEPAAAHRAIESGPDKVFFTGSRAAGLQVLERLAPAGIPSVMELSGCDVLWVREDADVDLAARALVFGLTFNGGATCLCPKRVLVHSSRAAELETRVAGLFADRPEADFQPAPRGVEVCVDEAMQDGARRVAGRAGCVPVVMGSVSRSARLFEPEFFAPVAVVVPVRDDAEALALANGSGYGLGASLFTRDLGAASKLAGLLRCGVVTVNDVIVPTADPRLPFAGRGWSGFGSTRGAEGLLEFTAPRVVTVTRGGFRPAYSPADAVAGEAVLSGLQLAHGTGWRLRLGAAARLARVIWKKATGKD